MGDDESSTYENNCYCGIRGFWWEYKEIFRIYECFKMFISLTLTHSLMVVECQCIPKWKVHSSSSNAVHHRRNPFHHSVHKLLLRLPLHRALRRLGMLHRPYRRRFRMARGQVRILPRRHGRTRKLRRMDQFWWNQVFGSMVPTLLFLFPVSCSHWIYYVCYAHSCVLWCLWSKGICMVSHITIFMFHIWRIVTAGISFGYVYIWWGGHHILRLFLCQRCTSGGGCYHLLVCFFHCNLYWEFTSCSFHVAQIKQQKQTITNHHILSCT